AGIGSTVASPPHPLVGRRERSDDPPDVLQQLEGAAGFAPASLRLGHHQKRVHGLAVSGIRGPERWWGDCGHAFNLSLLRANGVSLWLRPRGPPPAQPISRRR